MTDDEKTQRLLAEQRHTEIVSLLRAIYELLQKAIVKEEKESDIENEKTEGE